MHRRRYLQAAGASLGALFAGCSTRRPDAESTTDTPIETPTGADTPTVTETADYADSPGDIDVPQYIELLPDKHVGGTERTDNANFFRVDWKWYMETRNKEMRFGATDEEDWRLKPTDENFANAPKYKILRGPVNAVLVIAYNIENVIGSFPNAGPEVLQQCGIEATESGENSEPNVKEVVSYATPGVTYLIGVDTESLREAVRENESRSYEEVDITAHLGASEASGRVMYISDEDEDGIVAFETADAGGKKLRPTLRRLGDRNNSIIINESIKWCLSELTDFPIVVGEIDDGEQKLAGSGYSTRATAQLSEYDSIFQGFDTDGATGAAQLTASNVGGQPPNKETLERIYIEDEGSFNMTYNPDVSSISANWG